MPVHTLQNVPESVLLLGKHEFRALVSLNRKRNGDYFIKFNFQNLSAQQMEELRYLCKFQDSISVSSKLLNYEYGIHSFVVNKQDRLSETEIRWRCRWYASMII